jgi:pimeloyl-ACP methyl ester carboxylesterase
MAEIIGKYCEVMGTRTFYESCGDGIPMVCLHPVGGNTLFWKSVLEHFGERGYKVIAIDLPGHGKTLPKNLIPITSIEEYSAFVWEFIHLQGINNPILMGNAMGANIVLRMAGKYADGIKACVAVEGADHTPFGTQEGIELTNISQHETWECSVVEWCGRDTPKERVQELLWMYGVINPKIILADNTAYINHDARDLMPKIRCPVLLIKGEDDWVVPLKFVEDTKKSIKNAEMVVLKGTGHFPIVENPQEFCNVSEAFFRKHL